MDTDHLSLYQRGHELIGAKVNAIPPYQVAITIITVEEQMRGRLAQIRKATSPDARIQAYFRLHKILDSLNDFTVLDFDEGASQQFESLRQQKIRIGTQDLRIASIVLATGGILVSRNRKDFIQAPNLTIEDWSQPKA